jgi:hypothetical protein
MMSGRSSLTNHATKNAKPTFTKVSVKANMMVMYDMIRAFLHAAAHLVTKRNLHLLDFVR